MSKINVSIAGASGYTGLELLRILLRHPRVRVETITSETYAGMSIGDVFPSLRGLCGRKLVKLDAEISAGCDVLFLALPHTTGMSHLSAFLEHDCRIIDLSADFRLHDPAVFAAWYGTPHLLPEMLDRAVYGLPELHREQIASARLVANPGCYPTSIVLGLAPLMKAGWADPDTLVADSKSGVSGAGRKTSLTTQFAECNEGVAAYSLALHRHTPEVEQELSEVAGRGIRITFSPHLIPMTRGLLSTLYVNLREEMTAEDLWRHYDDYYKNEPFVRVLPCGKFANTSHVVHSNFCDIGVQVDTRTRRAIITSAIDNLVKGASGQAVQNMNLMMGFDEKTGLDVPAVFP